MDAKEIAKLAKMCRKSGINSLKINGNAVEFTLAPLPQKQPRKSKPQSAAAEETPAPTYTPDATLFWSSFGVGEDPPNG